MPRYIKVIFPRASSEGRGLTGVQTTLQGGLLVVRAESHDVYFLRCRPPTDYYAKLPSVAARGAVIPPFTPTQLSSQPRRRVLKE